MIQENESIIVYQAEVGSFFYKRKVILFNVTTTSSAKQEYCAIWLELTSGRAGNDMANAFTAILKKIVADNPNKTDFICWSDSIAQNSNSHISQAILEFLQRTPSIKSVSLK